MDGADRPYVVVLQIQRLQVGQEGQWGKRHQPGSQRTTSQRQQLQGNTLLRARKAIGLLERREPVALQGQAGEQGARDVSREVGQLVAGGIEVQQQAAALQAVERGECVCRGIEPLQPAAPLQACMRRMRWLPVTRTEKIQIRIQPATIPFELSTCLTDNIDSLTRPGC